jgi:hypothetical protein
MRLGELRSFQNLPVDIDASGDTLFTQRTVVAGTGRKRFKMAVWAVFICFGLWSSSF